MSPTLDVDKARSHFPSLKDGYIFADSAGGSQCIKEVVDRVSDYLLNTNVQLGADYSVSQISTSRVADGAISAATLINASSPDEISFGSSSTMLAENLARAMDKDVLDDEEIIITGEHESNASPWKKLAARRGLTLRTWASSAIPDESPNNTYNVQLSVSELLPLITNKTRIIALTACSNILGSIFDVKSAVVAIREEAAKKGARKVEVCVDCVAYAPHRRIDVQAWDVDYCYFSFYKVYGPHIGVLYTRSASLTASLSSLTHHFLDYSTSFKIQPGGPGYELVYGTTAILPYLQSLSPTGDLNDAFALIAAHEHELLKPLLSYLTSDEARKRGVCVVGSERADAWRVPTVSFVVAGERKVPSKNIVSVFDKKGMMGIRYGHFYAYTLVDSLRPELDMSDGVVRISLVHYNTVKEVERIVQVLKEALA